MLSKNDWLNIIMRRGKINKAQVLRELWDYAFLMEQASKVYCEITGGQLSKTGYSAETILEVFNEKYWDREIIRDDIENILETRMTKGELIEELRRYFELTPAGEKEGR